MADEQDPDPAGGQETHELGPPGGDARSRDLDPETAAEYRQAARAALRDEELDLALERLDSAVGLSEAAGDDDLAAGALVDRGNVRLQRVDEDPGDPRAEPDTEAAREAVEAAVADYTDALVHDPASGEAAFNRGLAYARLGDREASTADLERAVELSDRHADAFLVRGNSYAEAGADEAAREDFTRAIEETDAARAYFNRGNANRRLGDGDAAVADYRAALDRAEELPDDGRRVLLELADALDGEAAARQRVRAAWLAVASRDLWAGVDLAAERLREGPGSAPSTLDGPDADAGALVVAGDALHRAAGYREAAAAAEIDIEAVREALADADLPAPTATLFDAATGSSDQADRDAARDPAATELGWAVAERDDTALREAAVSEFCRQLRVYDR